MLVCETTISNLRSGHQDYKPQDCPRTQLSYGGIVLLSTRLGNLSLYLVVVCTGEWTLSLRPGLVRTWKGIRILRCEPKCTWAGVLCLRYVLKHIVTPYIRFPPVSDFFQPPPL